jgi:hypothetical protein
VGPPQSLHYGVEDVILHDALDPDLGNFFRRTTMPM